MPNLNSAVSWILRHKKAIAAVWILFVLFPNPTILPVDVYRLYQMPTAPTDDVKLIAASLPANGSTIEAYVDTHVQYTYDFQAYGAVWYLPTPSDVLKSHQGDCKSKAILTASLLEAKGIPHTLSISPVHFWVGYSGKPQTNFSERYETPQVAFVDSGRLKFPDKTDAFLYLNTYKDIVWTSMPLLRKIVLIGGLAFIIQLGHFRGPKNRLRRYFRDASAKQRPKS